MTKPLAPGDALPLQLKRYRDQRGWSLKHLAQECERHGAPQLTEASLANIERSGAGQKRGRRQVTVDELFILGYVLSVPPMMLVLPIGTVDKLEMVPGVVIHPDLAAQFLTGYVPPIDSDRMLIGEHDSQSFYYQTSRPARLYQRLREASGELDNARSDMLRLVSYTSLSQPGEPFDETDPATWRPTVTTLADWNQVATTLNHYTRTLEAYSDTLHDMLDQGIRPPALGKSILDEIATRGLHLRRTRQTSIAMSGRDLTKDIEAIPDRADPELNIAFQALTAIVTNVSPATLIDEPE